MIYRLLIGFSLGLATRTIADRVRVALSPLQRQRDLWRKINSVRFLLLEEDLELFQVLKLRLDSGLVLHPQHELRLKQMWEYSQERMSW